MNLGFSLRAAGRHHVPKNGPVLVISNHQSFLDPIIVGVASRRRLTALARKTLYENPAFAWLLRGLGAAPIDQEGIGIEGLRVGLHILEQGKALLVFPEGSRTEDGNLQPLKPGIQLLIKRSQAPVLPVGIAGSYDAWPCWRHYPIPAPLFLPPTKRCIGVSYGQMLDPCRLAGLSREALLELLTAELRKAHDQAERIRRK